MDPGLVLRAIEFASLKHRDQRRKDVAGSPYINHPIAVATLLWNHGVVDPTVIVAGVLHDTVEDTKTTHAELVAAFGQPVADVVAEVTDDKSLPKERRKELQVEHAPHLSQAAKLVKLADKICNLRDILESPPKDWPLERKQQYFVWSERVVAKLRGVHPELEQLFDSYCARRPQYNAPEVC